MACETDGSDAMTDQLWAAPTRQTPWHGEVVVPGSKSLTNRALVLAALADGPSVIEFGLRSRDTELMTRALVDLGARVEVNGDAWSVMPISSASTPAHIDCGLAGTVMRFLPAVAALGSAPVTFDGDSRARERPMGATISALRSLGVQVDDGGRMSLPFTVYSPHPVRGGELTIDASGSSQFVSALLLVAPHFSDGLKLQHRGSSLPSMPHVEMTVHELRRRGVKVESSSDFWAVQPGPISGLDVTIEPDLSNAGVFIAAAIASGGSVRMLNWPTQTDQPGDTWPDIITAMGGRVHRDGETMVFSAGSSIRGVELDLHHVGELTPVVAALAALADGPSTLTGIAHLRGHETDRLAALAREICALGGEVVELADGIHIVPRPLNAGVFHTYHDHRMAHAGVVLGAVVPGIEIENIATTSKTYPDFAQAWQESVG